MQTNLVEKLRIAAGAEIKSPYKETYDEADAGVFEALGIGMSKNAIREIAMNKDAYGFDEAPALQTIPSVGTPVQFLQWWSPKVIKTLYAKRVADEILGVTNAGSWEDAEVIVPEVETTGQAALYGDYVNGENSNFNVNFNKRAVVRFLSTVSVGTLEEMQISRMRMSAKERKMVATTNALEIQRNQVAFNGFLVGNQANYGILNDPRLPAYGTLPANDKGKTDWASKAYGEIASDIRMMLRDLEVKMAGLFSSRDDSFTMVLPMAASQAMTAVPQYNSYGFDGSVEAWFKKAYPRARIVYAPQFDKALGGQNVVLIFVDEIDGEKNADQFIQQKMFLVGFERRDTYIKETYSNATAGAFFGYGVGAVRYVGV